MLPWLDEVRWNADGLVPAIAVDAATDAPLMLAWMNKEALTTTVAEGRAVYWSRSRSCLWRKGEQSGHVQWLQSLWLDCDGDTVLMRVQQQGDIACHSGRRSCFYRMLDNDAWTVRAEIVRDPKVIYATKANP